MHQCQLLDDSANHLTTNLVSHHQVGFIVFTIRLRAPVCPERLLPLDDSAALQSNPSSDTNQLWNDKRLQKSQLVAAGIEPMTSKARGNCTVATTTVLVEL